MPRKLRFAPPGYWFHITQRGNYRQQTFFSPADYQLFLDLLAHHTAAEQVSLLSYCLMPNHIHLIARPDTEHALSRCLQAVTGQYAQALHSRLHRRGRFWQGRFFACLLDESHLLTALRYVELNPVRAHLAPTAEQYPWSSAAAHTGLLPYPDWLAQDDFALRFTPALWQARLQEGESRANRLQLRAATQAERILGSPDFLAHLQSQPQSLSHASPIRDQRRPPRSQQYPSHHHAAG